MKHKGPTKTYVELPDGRRIAVTTTPLEISYRNAVDRVEITASRYMKVELVDDKVQGQVQTKEERRVM